MTCEPRKSRGWLQCGCLFLFCALVALTGCSTPQATALVGAHRFEFQRDTFACANELVWEYRFDETGHWTSRPRKPKPDYTHHCFVVVRSAKQFFEHARFDPGKPSADEKTYRHLIREIVSSSPRTESSKINRIVVPGFANLRDLSREHEALLKAECGGAWQSYFQRGHWRMIFPFSRRHQEKTARELLETVRRGQPTVVHLVRFPSLKINHAVLLFDAEESDAEIRFAAYDPNAPEKPTVLTYDRATRTFSFPTNFYFPGGRVDVYEIYRGWCY